MQTIPTNNELVMLMLKNALEFNAGIVAMASVYVGNCTDKKKALQFSREYEKAVKEYEKRQEAMIAELIKDPTADEQKEQRY